MVKKILFISLLLLFPFVSMKSEVNWGIKGGVNVANLRNLSANNAFNTDSYTGFFVGPKLNVYLGSRLGFNGSALYSQSGMRFNNTDEKVDLNSLLLLVNMTLKVFGSDRFGLFMEVGPQFDFNLGQKRREIENKVMEFNNSNISFNAGLSLHLLSRLQIGVNYNYPFGTTKGFKLSDMSSSEAYKIYTLQLSAAIVF